MKLPSLALIAFTVLAVSCHKTHTSTPAPTPAPRIDSAISGLTGLRFQLYIDSAGINHLKYVTWNFSGTNPITATPSSDSSFFGYEQMFFTGPNVTSIVRHGGLPILYLDSMHISYTSAGQIDTIILESPQAGVPPAYRAYVFEYDGTHISKITQASSAYFPDSIEWHLAQYYYYSYTGGNISQLVDPNNGNISFICGTRVNKFAGGIPTYLLLEFILFFNSYSHLPIDLPLFFNQNMVDSIRYPGGGASVTNFMNDSAGGVTKGFLPEVIDTVYYYY